eukprot:1054114-Amphidinium_carterae.1
MGCHADGPTSAFISSGCPKHADYAITVLDNVAAVNASFMAIAYDTLRAADPELKFSITPCVVFVSEKASRGYDDVVLSGSSCSDLA